jgi:hypothetical protein
MVVKLFEVANNYVGADTYIILAKDEKEARILASQRYEEEAEGMTYPEGYWTELNIVLIDDELNSSFTWTIHS